MTAEARKPERCWYLRPMGMDEYIGPERQICDAGPTEAERKENLMKLARAVYWRMIL